jgi:hypothetical protein
MAVLRWEKYTLTEWNECILRPVAKEAFWHELVWLLPISCYETSSNLTPMTQSHRRTIVMQARNMKIDLRPRRDRECCLSTISITHCQGGILRSDLWDARYLIAIAYRWHPVKSHSIKRTGGLWAGCKSGVLTQMDSTHNSLRVS